jgi:hypothetical protein
LSNKVEMGMAVMSISSPEDGRPNAGLFDCENHHLVQAASREDIVVGENRADFGLGGRLRRFELLP